MRAATIPRRRLRRLILILLGIALSFGPSLAPAGDDDLAKELPRIKPLAPEAALGSFQIRPGFRLVPVAVEPLTTDPVAASYDADGRLYVAEMRGYPYPEDQPSGGVRLLTDTDGDGKFDKSTIFVDGLSWPTSVVPYDGGVFIAAAPDILYAKDTDGDGVADVKKTMFRGFGVQNVQALLNGLLWGPDGWIYGVSGGNGGEIRNLTRPDSRAVSVRGRDFRFRPDGSAFEAISGGGQFGHSFDDWGRRFTCNNSDHIRQILLPSRYLERNPALIVPAVIVDIAAEGPAAPVYRISAPEPWRVVRTRQRVADPAMVARLPPTERVAAGFFTSATGVTIYRGTAFPPEYRGNAFIGDVGGNLIHRKVLTRDGASFRAARAEPGQHVEFLASKDNWFRPVNFANTPNGTLLVLDMYRETIEHPASIPEPIKTHLDLTSGKDRGRLYEIIPEGFQGRSRPSLSRAKLTELVDLLADPDAWRRETAQRLLIERREPAALPLLKELARRRPNALGRAHALWTLDALGGLESADLLPCFADADPGTREQAARLSEGRVADSPDLLAPLLALANDPDPMVRFQTAFSLGEVAEPKAVAGLAAIAVRDHSSPWVRAAVLSSLTGRLPAFLAALGASPGFLQSEQGRAWFEELAVLAGTGNHAAEIEAIVARIAAPEADRASKRAGVIGLDRGLRRSGGSLRGVLRGKAAEGLAPLFAEAREEAKADASDAGRRVEAIRLVGLGPLDGGLEVLPELLDVRQPDVVQLAALQAMAGLPDGRVGALVVDHWKSLSPSVRREAAEVIFARAERLVPLLDAIEAKTLAATDLDPTRRKQLLTHADPGIRGRSSKLLGGDPGADRGKALAAFRPALALAGDLDKGRALFRKACATCHRAEGIGEEVGPDLATVAGRTPEDLLVHILAPNREVLPKYLDYLIATTDGRVLSGLIADESANAVILKRAGGVADVVPRGRIETISSTGVSLMPEGLERDMMPQDLADLIAYIRSLGTERPPAPVR